MSGDFKASGKWGQAQGGSDGPAPRAASSVHADSWSRGLLQHRDAQPRAVGRRCPVGGHQGGEVSGKQDMKWRQSEMSSEGSRGLGWAWYLAAPGHVLLDESFSRRSHMATVQRLQAACEDSGNRVRRLSPDTRHGPHWRKPQSSL